MLQDILKTRVMVKNSMKLYKDENLHKIFDSRQLSLKLIANVTFGYTAANFSGRMPGVEVNILYLYFFLNSSHDHYIFYFRLGIL